MFMEATEVGNIQFLLCFLTFLFDNGFHPGSIAGYLAGVKHAFVFYDLNVKIFENKSVSLLMKSFVINAPLKIRNRGAIDIGLFEKN